MPRGRSGPPSVSQLALKTLKLSQQTLNEIRTPIVWNRPAPGLYDYHYDAAGLYYQPMINYCIEREQGGQRRKVDMPDRLEANYSKRAYALREDECDYDGFLTTMYARRMKDKHSKKIHTENEKWSNSKKNTELNTVRGSANDRDRYLCQIQFIHTGRLASGQESGGRRASLQEDTEDYVEDRGRRSVSLEPVKPVDTRYGPNFEKKTQFYSKYLNKGGSAFAIVGLPEPPEAPKVDITKIQEKQILAADQALDNYLTGKEEERQFIEAKNMSEFLKLDEERRSERSIANRKEYKPLYNDTSYIKAHKDVQRSVKESGEKILENPLPKKEDINLNFRSRGLDQIGKYEKSIIRSEMYKEPTIGEVDVGYDTIQRRCISSWK